MTRRTFLGTAVGFAIAVLGAKAAAEDTRLRVMWWGTRERADRTNRAIEAFMASHPGVSVTTEYTSWLDYWQRFVTLVATRQTPDILQMDYRYLKEYANSGILLPLDDYLDHSLNIASFGQHNIDSCRVDGKLYGVNLGINSTAAYYDVEGWMATGVEPPTMGTTWEAFRDKCAMFTKGNKRPNYYATLDASGIEIVFESWLRQRGKALFDADGQLDFAAADAVEWFDYWADIRDFGGCVPEDVQVLYKHSIETSPLTLGYAAMDFAHSNMFLSFQQRLSQKLGLTAFPVTAGGNPGHYYKPSQMLSIAADSEAPDIAVALANFLVMDPRAVKILGVERGVPPSPDMRDLLLPLLDPISQTTLNYINDLEPFVGPLPPVPPHGAGEVAITLQRISHEVGFGVLTPKKGGERLVREASAILAR